MHHHLYIYGNHYTLQSEEFYLYNNVKIKRDDAVHDFHRREESFKCANYKMNKVLIK